MTIHNSTDDALFPVNAKIEPRLGRSFVSFLSQNRIDKRVALEQAIEAWLNWKQAQAEVLKKAGLLDAKVVN